MLYRHKPTVVTAVKLKGTASIVTPTGEQTACAGDYLVQRGEDQYVVTADIFEELYEPLPKNARRKA